LVPQKRAPPDRRPFHRLDLAKRGHRNALGFRLRLLDGGGLLRGLHLSDPPNLLFGDSDLPGANLSGYVLAEVGGDRIDRCGEGAVATNRGFCYAEVLGQPLRSRISAIILIALIAVPCSDARRLPPSVSFLRRQLLRVEPLAAKVARLVRREVAAVQLVGDDPVADGAPWQPRYSNRREKQVPMHLS
jgi:hypothetical protein